MAKTEDSSCSSYLRGLKRNLFLAYIKSLLLSLLFYIPIWYVFETQFASPATIGTIYAIAHLITVALELPTGALADLIDRKKLFFSAFWQLVLAG